MADTLEIFGVEYTGVAGIKATDDNDQIKTYIRPQGTKSISANGTGIDVSSYATANVSVPQNSFVITLEWNNSTERWEPNKTYVEIASAYQNELEIGLVCDTGNLAGCLFDDEENLFAYYVEQTVDETNYNYMTVRYFMLTANGIEEDSDGTQWFDSRDANAVASEVASGAQFFTSTGFAIGTATRRSSTDLSVSSATVTVPSGYYSAQASKTVASGTAGTPTASKGTVSNHSISVTPSVTNTTGYITGSTKTGTAVTVSASELVSGSETKTANGTYDVTNLAELVVNVGGTSKNVQVLQSTSRTNSNSLTKVLGDLTVSKTGTYDIYWSGGRSNTSTSYTWGTRLYVDGSGYGTENTTWSNNCQSNHLSNVSLTANQKLSVYARGRTGSYYTFVPMLTIIEA